MSKAAVSPAVARPWVPARGGLPKAEQTRRTRALIVETGIACLASAGYANTTMLLISQKAGISRGPLHYHFADRNALMAAIAEALPLTVDDGVVEQIEAARTIKERLALVIDIALDQHRGPHHFAAMELLLAARNDSQLAAAIGPHFNASEQRFDQWWVDYFGSLGWSDTDLLAFRHVAVAALRGLAIDHALQADAEAHDTALQMFRQMFMNFAAQKVPG